MLTPNTSISNLHQTLIVPGAQETQTTQCANVESVMAHNHGPIELTQVPGHYPTTPDTIPEPFTASKKLLERAEKLRKSMQTANSSEASKNSQILERAVIHGKYLEEYTKHAKANGLFHRTVKFPEIEAALGFENLLFTQVENSFIQAQKELEESIKLRGGERGKVPVSASNLKNLVRHQAALFDEQLQNFETARTQKLSPKDRAAVLQAELNFSLYAAQTTSSIPITICSMRNLAKMVVEELQEKLSSADAKIDTENDATSVLLQEWQAASTALDQTLVILVPELAASVERSRLAKTIKDLQGSGSWGAQFHCMAGQLLRQAVLSGVALGGVNSFTSELLSKTQIPTIIQMLLLASFTAVAHDFSTHILAAGILELTGGATKPVNGSDVISTKNKFISDNGNLRIKTASEIKIQHELQAKFKQELKYAENANKLGTVWSEAKYASIFGLAQGVGSLIGNGAGLSSTCSVIAGGIVGAAMAAGGLNAGALEPGGRKIPAMEPTSTSRTLGGAKIKIVSSASANMNYLNETNRQTIQNKFGGLLSGDAAKRLITFIANIIEARYPNAEEGIQAAARALGSVANLLALYGSMKIADETKAYVQERLTLMPPEGETAKGYFNFEGPKALATMSRHPNHPAIKQVFPEGSAGRMATNIADSAQKALNIPMATVNSIANGVAKYAIEKSANSIKHLRNRNTQSDPERDAPDST